MSKYLNLKAEFERKADAATAAKKKAYMRDHFEFYGVQTPGRRALTDMIIKDEVKRGTVDWQFLNECWADPHREFQYLVIDYLIAMQRYLTYDDVARIEPFVRSKQWWDTIDGLDRVIGDIAFVDPRINQLMLRWSTDPDFWVRRVAIDHQLCRKSKTDTELLERILVNNFGSKEFFINKAIGWSLRDYSKTNPEWVRDFIARYRSRLAPLSIREGSKYI